MMSKSSSNHDTNTQPSDQPPDTSGGEVNRDSDGSWWDSVLQKAKKNKWWLHVLAYVILIGAIILYGFPLLNDIFKQYQPSLSEIVISILGVIFFGILLSCIVLFTTPLPGFDNKTGDDAEDQQKRGVDAESFVRLKRYWMILAYTFMIFSLVTAVLPFTLDLTLDPDDSRYNEQVNSTLDRPITIFQGCVLDNSGAPNALSCSTGGDENPPMLSWVVHIGGHLTAFNNTDNYIAKNDENRQELARLEKILEKKNTAKKSAKNYHEKVSGEWQQLNKSPEDNNDRTAGKLKLEKAESDLKKAKLEVVNTRREIDNIERFIQGNAGYGVSGGLVVPFYLIVLSMIGAAISLTRRIPEYQKQAVPGYVGTKTAPYLSPPMLREYLVFQIIQFVSAPFLAAVAYFVMEPSTTQATVGLAFAAGFTSETVLLWVRGMVEKMQPESAPEVLTGSVVGSIPEMKSKTASDVEKELSISIVGRPDLPAVFTGGGQFVIKGVPIGTWALEVVKRDVAGTKMQTIYQRITVEADKPVPVLIDFGVP